MQGFPPIGFPAQPSPWLPAGAPFSMLPPFALPSAGGAALVPPAATSPSLGAIPAGGPIRGTYVGPGIPTGGPPPLMPMPGPSALGDGFGQGPLGAGGARGVGINPVSPVTPPAATGGPHPLPPMPSCPLPIGFPNPFERLTVARPSPAPGDDGGPQPYSPGTVTISGPVGHLPGIGYFGTPGGNGQAPLPGPLQPGASLPAAPSPQAAAAWPGPQPADQPASPFWTALAWQLVSIPAVRETLGDRLTALLEGQDRLRAIQVATRLLLTPELQAAFRALAAGAFQQTPFAKLFAERLKEALEAESLAPTR